MKKIVYAYFLMLFIVCNSAFAQTETDTTFFTQMNHIFANLDK